MKLTSIDQYIKDLDTAFRWLDVTQGRATQCKKCLEEILDGAALSEKRLMACYEAFDLVEIYQLWRENEKYFPGLKNKLKQIFVKGPLLIDDERAEKAKSVESRNNAFAAIIAGRLLEAQFDVLQVEKCRRETIRVSTTADCTIKLKREIVNVECKRLHSQKNWPMLAEKAKSQIRRNRKKGFVALDCSVLIRPKDTVFSSNNDALVAEEHLDWLEQNIFKRASDIFSSIVLGLLLYTRVPSMIETPRLGKNHFSPRKCVVTSFLLAPYAHNKFAIRMMAAIKRNLQDRAGTVNVREISSGA